MASATILEGLSSPVRHANFLQMSTVQEIKAAIDALPPAERAELERLVLESPPLLDPEVDSPELEAELLKAVKGPHAPFSEAELRSIADRALTEHRTQSGQ